MAVDRYAQKDETDIYSYVHISTVLELSLDHLESFCSDVIVHAGEINDSIITYNVVCKVLTICVPTYINSTCIALMLLQRLAVAQHNTFMFLSYGRLKDACFIHVAKYM